MDESVKQAIATLIAALVKDGRDTAEELQRQIDADETGEAGAWVSVDL